MSDHHDDDWFQHSPSEGEAQEAHGEINAPLILGFLAVVVLTVAALFVGLGGFFSAITDVQKTQKIERNDVSAQPYREQKAGWDAELGSSAWIDEAENIVRVPIDVAMADVVRRYQEGAPVAAVPPAEAEAGAQAEDAGAGEMPEN